MCQSCTPRAASAVACESGLNVAGIPTTSECAGASFVTTPFAPMALHPPLVPAPSPLAPPPAEGDPVVEHHVVAEDRGLADHDAHAVVDEEASADRGPRMDLHAREE